MRVAIIGAMEEEVTLLRSQLVNAETTEIAGYEYTSGELQGVSVVLLKSGIGKVNAALSTGLLIQTFNPTHIINTGSAGGLNPDLKIGDVVISEEVRHHDVDATVFGYEYGQVPQMPAAYVADEKLVKIATESVAVLEDINVEKGLIASGDSFMSDVEKLAVIQTKFNNLQAVEMEAAAIGQVAVQFNVPFVVIRSLSDIPGKGDNAISFEEFLETAATNSAALVRQIVKLLGA